MKPYEIFRLLSSPEVDALVLAACEDDEIPDQIAASVLTLQRVPLKRFERLHEDVRKGYVRKTLRDKRAEDLSLFVLSAGLTRTKEEMIESFLAALDLPGPVVEGVDPRGEGDLIGHPAQVIGFDADGQALRVWPFGARRSDWIADLPRIVEQWS